MMATKGKMHKKAERKDQESVREKGKKDKGREAGEMGEDPQGLQARYGLHTASPAEGGV